MGRPWRAVPHSGPGLIMTALPSLRLQANAEGSTVCILEGSWTLACIGRQQQDLQQRLQATTDIDQLSWDGTAIEALDTTGALLLWRAWSRQLPEVLILPPQHVRVFERVAAADALPAPAAEPLTRWRYLHSVGAWGLSLWNNWMDFVALVGNVVLNLWFLIQHPRELPAREITANLYKAGVCAMPVTAMVGFLIGVAMSYLSALQLRQFGADVFIINILGLGVVRELGPVLAAVLVAGRSGSAMTAQLGVMRVTEEIDALATMGVMRTLRLVLPKVLALAIAMPFLVLFTSVAALFGGWLSASFQLDLSAAFFIETLPKAVPALNLWIALGKGAAFGAAIALVACHYGLRVQPNTESLSQNTTASVVVSIAVVIVIDAIFAIALRGVGMPWG